MIAYVLTPARPALDIVAEILKCHPEARVKLVVDTDCPPDKMYMRTKSMSSLADVDHTEIVVGNEAKADELRRMAARIGYEFVEPTS